MRGEMAERRGKPSIYAGLRVPKPIVLYMEIRLKTGLIVTR